MIGCTDVFFGPGKTVSFDNMPYQKSTFLQGYKMYFRKKREIITLKCKFFRFLALSKKILIHLSKNHDIKYEICVFICMSCTVYSLIKHLWLPLRHLVKILHFPSLKKTSVQPACEKYSLYFAPVLIILTCHFDWLY